MKTIYFDTETTGLDYINSRIIEIALLIEENGVIEPYNEFINIGFELPPKITQITGITDDMLVKKGISEESVARYLKETLTPGSSMIAHNCQFDLSFIYQLLKRHYPEEAMSIVESLDWFDTLTILKDCKDYPHKLKDAVEYCGLEEVNFHRAIDDTKALCEVVKKLKSTYRPEFNEYINIFGYNPKWGIKEDEKFDFIKYVPQPYHNRGCLPPNDILPRK